MRVTSSRFIGRARELAELEAALRDASGGRPSLAFIAGESGVGKTRLLKELERNALTAGARVISGDCVSLGEDELPYAPIVAALRSLTRDGDPVLDELGPVTRAGLASLLPELADPSAQGERDREDLAQGRVFEALLTLLDRLGRDEPVVLAIEDLHWADHSTRALLVFLARSLRAERVLVVASYRPDELHRRHPLRSLLAELERAPRSRRIELAPLSRDELAEQLADILGAPADPALVKRLHARSEGNPFFTEELLAAGLDGRGELPSTMRGALMVRIDALPPDAQELLRLLAVARRVDHALLADASTLDASALRDALREAVAGHVIVVDRDGRYGFRHALLREVVHDDLLPGEHAELHLALARALERRVEADGPNAQALAGIAHHYLSAGDQPKALTAAIEAADSAESVHAHGEAARLYERALELWPRVADAAALTGLEQWALLKRAGLAHDLDGHRVRAVAMYEAALALVDETVHPQRAAGLMERLAGADWGVGRAESALATLERGLALLPANDVSRERALLLSRRASILMLRGRHRSSIEAARAAIPVAQAAGEPIAWARGLRALGTSLMNLGEIEEGAAQLRAAIDLAVAQARPRELESSYVNLAENLHQVGRSEEARAIVRQGLDGGASRHERCNWLELLDGEIAFDMGDWAFAERHIVDARPYAGTTFVNAVLRRAELAMGHGDAALSRELLQQAQDALRDSDEPQFLGVLGALRAELERRAGDLDAARAAVLAALDRIETCTDDVVRLARVATIGAITEADAAQRARDVGDAEGERRALLEAEFHVARVRAAADDGGPIESAWLGSAEAEYARATGASDPALHEAAAETWEAVDRPYPGAIMRWRAAEGYIAAGDRDAATASLERAHEVTSRLGANWLQGEIENLAARARLSLAATGAPAREPLAAVPGEEDDPFGLTPRERQVLALVAEGRTNREIGETLFMAEKTASVHVSRILAKLDVRSRTEAAAVAHRLGLDDGMAVGRPG
jgi:ATP/maltotriose-dependent transcriptional regulator MalT